MHNSSQLKRWWNQLELTVSMKAGHVRVLFFVFFTVLCVLHQSNPEHDYSCSWNPANPSTQNNETKTIWIKPMWKKKIKPIKSSNWSNDQTQQTEPIKWIYPANGIDQTQQTHRQSTHPPPPSSEQPIKPPANQPIHHHWVPKSNPSNPLPINPSNPPPINQSTTTEFPNQETKTLVLHKTKLHGRKRKEAPPCAYWREREIDVYWERSKKNKIKRLMGKEWNKKLKKQNKNKNVLQ